MRRTPLNMKTVWQLLLLCLLTSMLLTTGSSLAASVSSDLDNEDKPSDGVGGDLFQSSGAGRSSGSTFSGFSLFAMDAVEEESDLAITVMADTFLDNLGVYPDGFEGLIYSGYQDFGEGEDYGDITAFLKFDLWSIDPDKTVEKAELLLFIGSVARTDPEAETFIELYGSDDDDWAEDLQVIPSYDQGSFIGQWPLVTSDAGSPKSFDVTDFIKSQQSPLDNVATFVLTGPSNPDEYEIYENAYSIMTVPLRAVKKQPVCRSHMCIILLSPTTQ